MNHHAKVKHAGHEERSQRIDPVCAMAVSPGTAAAVVERDGREHYSAATIASRNFFLIPVHTSQSSLLNLCRATRIRQSVARQRAS